MENLKPSLKADFAIVLPCHSPFTGWEESIVRLYHHLINDIGRDFAIVIINDGSSLDPGKESLQYLKKHCSKFLYLVNKKNRGKGRSLRRGIRSVEAEYYVYTDFDLPFLFENISAIYRTLKKGYDIVASKRGEEYLQKLTIQRKLFSQFCSFLNKQLLHSKFPDSQAGLKGFNNRGKEIFLQTTIDRYLFDTEFILLAERLNSVKLTSIDVQVQDTAQFSNMSLKKIFPELRNYLRLLKQ